ncbi:MAG: ParA family protein [Gammaproteobacteria bacterium]|jgi:chromosome partitioning protein
MKKILVINSKGGCGKTTLATNLASYYAYHGEKAALMDYDPQGSSMQWLKLRPHHLNSIHGANAARRAGNVIRSWQMVIPRDVDKLIIDAPAGIDGILMQELVQRADSIVIPVAPSPVDIHATSDFIRDLFLIGKVRTHKTELVVIANRVRSHVPLYEPLKKFLTSLNIPFIGTLTDTDNFVEAMGMGMGISEMDFEKTLTERMELQPLIDWLGDPIKKDKELAELFDEKSVAFC